VRGWLLAAVLLAGCRGQGPSFAGDWEAIAATTSASMRLVLSHDPGAVLDAEVEGELVDVAGARWSVAGDPPVVGGAWRVTLRGGVTLLDDDGAVHHLETGPIDWRLARAGEQLLLEAAPAERPLGIDPPAGPTVRCTFRRPAAPAPAPPAERCPCGEPLQAHWKVCPACGRGR
jgi:hypothetical protein